MLLTGVAFPYQPHTGPSQASVGEYKGTIMFKKRKRAQIIEENITS